MGLVVGILMGGSVVVGEFRRAEPVPLVGEREVALAYLVTLDRAVDFFVDCRP